LYDDARQRFGVLPACDSYLVSRAAASRLAAAFLPVRVAAHVHLTYLFRALDLNVRLAVPNVFVDGSKLGFFPSSLDPNNRLLWNQPYCKLEAFVRQHASRPSVNPTAELERDREFQLLCDAQPFKDHPDVLGMRARFLAACGRTADAEVAFAAALQGYDRHGCVVDAQSELLREYLRLYARMQGDIGPQLLPSPGQASAR
jgi:hypothetical protein